VIGFYRQNIMGQEFDSEQERMYRFEGQTFGDPYTELKVGFDSSPIPLATYRVRFH
jgi:hypothetical protein